VNLEFSNQSSILSKALCNSQRIQWQFASTLKR